MKFYQIGYSGHEDVHHFTLVGDAVISQQELQDAVAESFNRLSIESVNEIKDGEEIRDIHMANFSDLLSEVVHDVAKNFELQVVDKTATVAWAWEYEFSKKAADILVSRYPEVLQSDWHGSFRYDYKALQDGKVPNYWRLTQS